MAYGGTHGPKRIPPLAAHRGAPPGGEGAALVLDAGDEPPLHDSEEPLLDMRDALPLAEDAAPGAAAAAPAAGAKGGPP
eukprot:gene9811-2162_t